MFRCKVHHHTKYTEMCILRNTVGRNSHQMNDGHISKTLHVCKRKLTPQSKTSNKDNFFTLTGLITLSEKSLICVVIFQSVKYYSHIETGIDFTVNSRGSSNNQQEFFENNLEHGKASFELLTDKDTLF